MKGHVQKKSGRYLLVLELDHELDPATGERIRRRRRAGSFRTRAEADDALRDALERSRHGWRGPSRLTVADYLREEWLPGVDMQRAATTAALYRTICEAYIIPGIGGMQLDALSPAVLTRLYADLLRSGARGGKPLAPKTVRHVHTTLRKALADAVEARHIAYNPAQGAKAPKLAPTTEPNAWTAQELARFLAHVAGDRLEALWVLAASSGMRRGELLGARWADLDLEAAELKVRQTLVAYGSLRVLKEPKTAASRRTIPLDPRAGAALKTHRKTQAAEKLAAGPAYEDRGLVFADEIGDPLAPETVSAAFKRHVREAQLPRLTIHGLRHTYATLGLDAGVDVLYVAELLGHSSPSITMGIYQHVRHDRLTQAAERIGAEIFGA